MQSLPLEEWEVVLVDNGSKIPVAQTVDLSCHPHFSIISEPELGLTLARLRGIKESKGSLIVFVDDDNILSNNYLEIALRIAEAYPFLGAWGGSTLPEYEVSPPEWFNGCEIYIGVREIKRDSWSNFPAGLSSVPIGAGMIVRRTVAEFYADSVRVTSYRRKLGRVGNLLTGGEDIDIAYSSCDLGLGKGVFKELKLIHLIPASRLEEPYILKLAEGSAYSDYMLRYYRDESDKMKKDKKNILDRLRLWRYLSSLSQTRRRIVLAEFRGIKKAQMELANT